MTGERHFVEVDGRRVLYRRWGDGPAVFVLHGSPQASRAVAAVAEACAAAGLCAIAPDTPGAGRSDPLPGEAPESADYARALAALADKLGLKRVGLYGFHTGAATACAFAGLFPERTAAVALEGLPAWTRAEREDLIANYLPPFLPRWDGAHMAWLWARMEEQTVFFPWHAPTPAARMAYDVSPPAGVHANCMDLLDAADAYRAVYRAAFAFEVDAWLPRLAAPALITTAVFDVLRCHLDRPPLAGRGRAFETLPALHAAVAAHLAAHPGDPAPPPPAAAGRGFVAVGDERIAWRAVGAGEGRPRLLLHSAGGSSDEFADDAGPAIALDLPGHGDSAEGWAEPPAGLAAWTDAVEAACAALGLTDFDAAGTGAGAAIAAELARRGHAVSAASLGPGGGDPSAQALGSISLTPEWDGAHLVRAFRVARWERLFSPWPRRTRADARRPFGDLDPASVHARAVALLKAHDRWLAAAKLEG